MPIELNHLHIIWSNRSPLTNLVQILQNKSCSTCQSKLFLCQYTLVQKFPYGVNVITSNGLWIIVCIRICRLCTVHFCFIVKYLCVLHNEMFNFSCKSWETSMTHKASSLYFDKYILKFLFFTIKWILLDK